MSQLRSLAIPLSVALIVVTFVWISPAFAASGDLSKIEGFIKNIITALVTIAGLLSAVFLVMGGIGYITSSGNPEHLDKSKRTIIYSAIGLAVTIGAYVISNTIADLATSAFN